MLAREGSYFQEDRNVSVFFLIRSGVVFGMLGTDLQACIPDLV